METTSLPSPNEMIAINDKDHPTTITTEEIQDEEVEEGEGSYTPNDGVDGVETNESSRSTSNRTRRLSI
eukprot:scaffold3849_cov264-Ochromonas_danica.AAC.7